MSTKETNRNVAWLVAALAIVCGFPAGAFADWEYAPPLALNREMHAVAKDGDGLIYAIGGSTQYPWDRTPTVERFDEGTGVWSFRADLNIARSGLSAATDADGRVYAIGGGSADGPETTVERYDPVSDSWGFVAETQTPHGLGSATTGLDGSIYAIGGGTDQVERYDPAANTWEYIEPLPSVRSSFASVTDFEGRIYVIGGVVEGGPSGSDVLRYDPTEPDQGWVTLPPPPMYMARQLPAAVVDSSGDIWVMGGSGSGWVTGSVEIYDPVMEVWSDGHALQQPRNALGAALSDLGNIYAVGGGEWTNPLNVVEVIPEPGTLSPLLLGGIVALRRRR